MTLGAVGGCTQIGSAGTASGPVEPQSASANTGSATATPSGAPSAASASPSGALLGAATPGPIDNGDYEVGLRYDYGVVTAVRREADDQISVQFNRQQLHTDDGLRSGTQLTAEPVVYGNSDVPWVDDNDRLRRYVLAPDAEVLRLADPAPCGGGPEPAGPVWQSLGVRGLDSGALSGRTQDALTFDETGRVSRVRLSTSC